MWKKWIECCIIYEQVNLDPWFKQHKRRLCTWKSPNGKIQNQNAYTISIQRFRNIIKKLDEAKTTKASQQNHNGRDERKIK